MKINTHNYEAYLLDFMEGNLSSSDEIELRKFVRLHPHLQIDLEKSDDLRLIPEKIIFDKKKLLKENPETAINEISKIERLSIAFLENEMKQEELNELNLLIENRRYLQIFNNFQKIKLNKPKIIYKNKELLKRKSSKYIFNFLYRAAAFIVLLLSLTFWFSQRKNVNKINIELTALKEIPLRKTHTFNENSLQFSLVANILKQKDNQYITNAQTNNKELEKELDFITPRLARKIGTINLPNMDFSFAQNNNKVLSQTNNQENTEIKFKQKVVWTTKKTAKRILYKIAYSVRKNIHYKKQYLDDGRVLIALKAGDFEFKRIKEEKRP
jgi:hypothetical protein